MPGRAGSQMPRYTRSANVASNAKQSHSASKVTSPTQKRIGSSSLYVVDNSDDRVRMKSYRIDKAGIKNRHDDKKQPADYGNNRCKRPTTKKTSQQRRGQRKHKPCCEPWIVFWGVSTPYITMLWKKPDHRSSCRESTRISIAVWAATWRRIFRGTHREQVFPARQKTEFFL